MVCIVVDNTSYLGAMSIFKPAHILEEEFMEVGMLKESSKKKARTLILCFYPIARITLVAVESWENGVACNIEVDAVCGLFCFSSWERQGGLKMLLPR